MSRFDSPLNRVTVAAPCSAGWDRMRGNERIRFCEQCSLNVYNLSAMSKSEAETLIMQAEGRLCVRYYRRADGTILTNNCPVGLHALKRRVTKTASGIFAAFASFFAGVGVFSGAEIMKSWLIRADVDAVEKLQLEELTNSVEPLPVAGELVLQEEGWVDGVMFRPPI